MNYASSLRPPNIGRLGARIHRISYAIIQSCSCHTRRAYLRFLLLRGRMLNDIADTIGGFKQIRIRGSRI
jgi:hypothetical protein